MTAPNLKNRLALITGASRGIGAALAKGFAAQGAHVILLARTVGALEELDDEISAAGGQATLLPMDLTKLSDIDKIGPTLAERFGALDIFIGNAALLGPLSPTHHVKPKEWDRAMKINFMANARLVHTLDPLLRASDAGRIIFSTTSLAREPRAYWGPYASSKAALESFARTYALETLQTNMKINLIDPGIVDTYMLGQAFPGGYDGVVKKPEDVVEAYLELAAPSCTTHGELITLS